MELMLWGHGKHMLISFLVGAVSAVVITFAILLI